MSGEKRILVVDDSPALVAMVSGALRTAGYDVLTAGDGLAGVNAAVCHTPDLVISDVEMPEMTGLQMCRLLKGDPRTSGIPLLMLSAHSEQHEQFWGRESGADDYLPKPFTPCALLERVGNLLSQRRSRERAPSTPGGKQTTRTEALERDNAILERQLFELTVVHGISEVAATAAAPRETMQGILGRVSRLIEFSVALVAGPRGGGAYVAVRRPVHPRVLADLHGRALAALPPTDDKPPMPNLLCGGEHISTNASSTSTVALQLLHSADAVVGVLGVAREEERPFTDPDRSLLQLIAGQAALVVENARLVEAERQHLDMLKRYNVRLEATVAERTDALHQALQGLVDAHLDTMHRLAVAAEFRDQDTAAHIRRIGDYCALIGEEMELPPETVHALRFASPMHDVGKIGIPDGILLKPGRLTPDEFQTMTKHTLIGARILGDSNAALLQAAEEIAMTHHERWDGSGYPRGLAGEQIPLSGRVCAVADVFDALTTVRAYKPAMSNAAAWEVLRQGRGSHFDPEVLDFFLGNLDQVTAVQSTHGEMRANR